MYPLHSPPTPTERYIMHILFAVTSKNARQKATYMGVSSCVSTPVYFFFEFSDVDSLSGACSSQLALVAVIQAYYYQLDMRRNPRLEMSPEDLTSN